MLPMEVGDIDGTATITVWVGFRTGRDKDWVLDYKSAKLKCLVGGISHNIMSTTTLCECGWEFNQGPDGFHVKDVKTGRTVEVAFTMQGAHGSN